MMRMLWNSRLLGRPDRSNIPPRSPRRHPRRPYTEGRSDPLRCDANHRPPIRGVSRFRQPLPCRRSGPAEFATGQGRGRDDQSGRERLRGADGSGSAYRRTGRDGGLGEPYPADESQLIGQIDLPNIGGVIYAGYPGRAYSIALWVHADTHQVKRLEMLWSKSSGATPTPPPR